MYIYWRLPYFLWLYSFLAHMLYQLSIIFNLNNINNTTSQPLPYSVQNIPHLNIFKYFNMLRSILMKYYLSFRYDKILTVVFPFLEGEIPWYFPLVISLNLFQSNQMNCYYISAHFMMLVTFLVSSMCYFIIFIIHGIIEVFVFVIE